MSAPIDITTLPLILYDPDLCAVLEISCRTLKRRRSLGAFPIPELPALDRKHRYGRADVLAYMNRETSPTLARRRAS
jgi:hypothetical protein